MTMDLARMIEDDAATQGGEYGQATALGQELVDVEREITDLEERTSEKKKRRDQIRYHDLVDAMQAAGVDRLGLEPHGNHPGYDMKLLPYCHANIPVSWDEQKREKAFDYLDQQNAKDLYTTEVVLRFGRGQEIEANRCVEDLKSQGYSPAVRRSTPWSTLTAWVKEQVFEKRRTIDLECVGATIGSIVKLAPRKG
jgi:hypothetical protein